MAEETAARLGTAYVWPGGISPVEIEAIFDGFEVWLDGWSERIKRVNEGGVEGVRWRG